MMSPTIGALMLLVILPGIVSGAGPPLTDLQLVVGEKDNPRKGLVRQPVPGWTEDIHLDYRITLQSQLIKSTVIKRDTDPGGAEYNTMEIAFTPFGARQLARVTDENVGRYMAIVIGGNVVWAGEIQEPLYTGVIALYGSRERNWTPLKQEIDARIEKQ